MTKMIRTTIEFKNVRLRIEVPREIDVLDQAAESVNRHLRNPKIGKGKHEQTVAGATVGVICFLADPGPEDMEMLPFYVRALQDWIGWKMLRHFSIEEIEDAKNVHLVVRVKAFPESPRMELQFG